MLPIGARAQRWCVKPKAAPPMEAVAGDCDAIAPAIAIPLPPPPPLERSSADALFAPPPSLATAGAAEERAVRAGE